MVQVVHRYGENQDDMNGFRVGDSGKNLFYQTFLKEVRFELQFRTALQALDWKYAGLAENLWKIDISDLYLEILVQEIWDGAQDCLFMMLSG